MRVLRWAGRLWTGVLLVIVLLAGLLLGLRLLLPLLSPPPELLAATPPDGAAGISPRTAITLRFSTPMSPLSVARTLRVEPETPLILLWSTDYATLTISPTANLRPDATYRVQLGTRAISRRFRALDTPIAIEFHTAPAPAVVRVLPPAGSSDVALTSPISIKFSRPIVPTTTLMLATSLPELRFDPSLAGMVTWVDQSTVLFRPAEPLRPGIRYRATLDAGLTDLGGGQLGGSFAWSFSTPAPKVLAVMPAAGTRWVAPRAPLTIALSQPLDLPVIARSLVISPTNTGALAAVTLPDNTQVITYTPAADWRPGATYTAALRVDADLPGQEIARWSFTTAPRPALTGRFPGEGQTLPPGQEIRLIFNTPMDSEALRTALQFTPPVSTTSVLGSNAEVRIGADLRPATIYTMTLPADLADRNGVRLGQAYQIRFQTAPAVPRLALPGSPAHLAQVLPGQLAELPIERTNLSALNVDLYRLDEATVVRTLAFGESDWTAFQPERYAQSLLRSWSLSLADPLNAMTAGRLVIAETEGQPLAPGAYYVRVRTPEGPRADLLLIVSRTRLALEQARAGLLIWATDVISTTPIDGLPITLYQGGALIREGTTDARGIWQVAQPGSAAQTYIAFAGGDRFGLVGSAWAGTYHAPASEQYRVFLTTDRAAYQPGEQVAFAGFVRRTGDLSQTVGLPAGQALLLSARRLDTTGRIYQEQLSLSTDGRFSGDFTLADSMPPGSYLLTATLDGTIFQTPFIVRTAPAQPLQVTVDLPAPLIAGEPIPIAIDVATPEGLPVAGAIISWTIEAERAPLPALPGYTIGDDERIASLPAARGGMGLTDPSGRLSFVISDTITGTTSLRYHLVARASEPGGLSAVAEGDFLAAPGQAYVGLALPSQIMAAGQPGTVELLATTPAGQPLPQAAVHVDIYRRTWDNAAGTNDSLLREELVFSRNLTTGDDGTAVVSPTLRAGGEYRVRAGMAGQPPASAISLWVTAPGFSDWRPEMLATPVLIADRPAYRPGDTATLLLTTSISESTALVVLDRPGAPAAELRSIRAGEPFTLTLGLEDAPAARVVALLVARQNPPAGSVPPAPPLITAQLPIILDTPAISVTIATDRASYAPGATATLTITTTDAAGRGIPASVILGITSADDAPAGDLIQAFGTGIPPARASQPLTGSLALAHATPGAPSGIYWNPRLRTGNNGVLSLTVTLLREPIELRASVWAVSNDRYGQAQRGLAVAQPFVLDAQTPPFFRAGDAVELGLRIRNTSAITQELRVTLAAGGVEPQPGAALTQRVTIAPGATTRVTWPAQVGTTLTTNLSFSAQAGSIPQTIQFERPILPSGTPEATGAGALVPARWTSSFTVTVDRQATWGQLELEIAPSGLALAHDYAHMLAGRPARSTLDEAGLLLVSATLSDTRPLARAALDRLIALQRDDGGWGWWPGAPSDPFVSAAVLEALAAAEGAGLAPPETVIARAGTVIEAALASSAASPDLRAYALYVLALHNRADPDALRDLATRADALGPSGLAYLLLAGDPDSAPENLLSRLERLAAREGDLAHWPAREDTTLLDTETGATALAALALVRARPESDLIPAARRWLAATRPIGGWPESIAGARALATLRLTDPPARAGRYAIALNGSELLEEPISTAITTTRRLVVPIERLNQHNELLVTSSGGSIFAAYRLTVTAPPMPPREAGAGLLREYLDPLTGRLLDPAGLRAGQLVRIRLTAIVGAPRRFLTISEPLPSGISLIDTPAGTHFEHAARAGDRLLLTRATVAPGIYEYSYLMRAVVPGRYAIPPAEARTAAGTTLGTSAPATMTITSR